MTLHNLTGQFLVHSKMQNLLFLLFILFISSCKKEEPVSQVKYNYLNQNLKTDYSFNPNSYWVYENQNSNIDSVVLVNQETGFTSVCPQNDCARNEFITLTFKSMSRGVSFNQYLMSNFIRYNGGGTFGQHGQPIHILNRDQGYQFNGLVVGEVFDSLQVSNTMYYNVEKMTVQADQQFQKKFDYDRDFYFVPSIGIVRIVIHDHKQGVITWDLKRYHLE
ncbi:hypothetical protein KFE94_12670 [bacterium SCSIO 12643]|nr:hypothetical protein KFE94_12670 [bacterium SCSIO 12643]